MPWFATDLGTLIPAYIAVFREDQVMILFLLENGLVVDADGWVKADVKRKT